ncbi:uncharacterized protein LOC114517009 [Dendronephthya gigantea]|uniref:uncharacterized protein LOC114517009 n=1 Tax=Dendronephthya gigantea TaxID=151771 RepID=UPI00106BBB5A|nr:uncharacterized protein LOC114517009 [Dendronephthya gigantea]
MADKETNIKLATEAFKRLQKRAKQLEIDRKNLRKIKSLNALKTSSYRRLIAALICVVTLVLLPPLTYKGFTSLHEETQKNFMQFIADNVLYFDLEKDVCLLQAVEPYLDLFRPPVNCSICENVDTVDVVTDLSKDEFLQKYAYTGRPVLIRNGSKGWSALSHFNFEFFKNIYPKGSPVLQSEDKDCQFFPYRTSFESLGEVFNMSKSMARMEGKPWYIGWSNCDSNAANVLRKYYEKPYFLPEESESSRTDWIFMGCPGYGAHLHIDAVGKPSWQAQIKGTKQWILEPPPECYFKCQTSKHVVVVQPGDIIVLDTNRWFHQTDIIGSDMSITIGSEYD